MFAFYQHTQQSLRSLLGAMLRIVLMLLVGMAILLRIFESRLLFYPERSLSGVPSVPFQNVSFQAADGTRLHGWFLPLAPARHVFLVSHGNAGNISDRAVMGEFLQQELRGNVFMYDYRGYGQSEGQPSEQGLYSDISGAFQHLRSRGFESSAIYLIGQSLGAAVTVDLACREGVAGVILEAPFPSVRAVARRITHSIPLDVVMRSRFDSLSKVLRIRAPIVVVHAQEDPVIPPDLGRTLFDAIPGPRKLFSPAGRIHEGALMALGVESIRELQRFLRIGP